MSLGMDAIRTVDTAIEKRILLSLFASSSRWSQMDSSSPSDILRTEGPRSGRFLLPIRGLDQVVSYLLNAPSLGVDSHLFCGVDDGGPVFFVPTFQLWRLRLL